MPRDCKDETSSQSGNASACATIDLRLLSTSDLHVNIAPFDYYTDLTCLQRGLAMTATLISAARAEVPNTLLFDNGDFLNGSPLGDFVAFSGQDRHPMIDAMNTLSYDAVNLGNHEFSIGIDPLLLALRGAQFPILASNVVSSHDGAPFVQSMALLTRTMLARDGSAHEIRVGIAGLLPPQTAMWNRQAIAGRILIEDMLPTARSCIAKLRDAGADVVVILAHCGIDRDDAGTDHEGDTENIGVAISRLEGIDALVLGHTHLSFPGLTIHRTDEIDPALGRLNDVPTVMPGFFGSHLGVIDLQLQRDAKAWKVVSDTSQLRAISARDAHGRLRPLVAPDPAILSQVATLHEETRRWTRKPISNLKRPLHSYFTMITDVPAIQLIHNAQITYVQARLRGSQFQDLPVLSATAPFKAGGRGGPENYSLVPAGEVLMRHASDMYVHLNTVVAIWVTGAELRSWLERASLIFNTIFPGQHNQPLINPSLPHFHFDSIGGITYDIDLTSDPLPTTPSSTENPKGRIRNLHWQGNPVADDQRFILATNSYRASGSGGFTRPDHRRTVFSAEALTRDVLIEHLRSKPSIAELEDPSWAFLHVPDTSVLFETSPKAIAYIDDVPHLNLEAVRLTRDGFLSMRLTL